MENSMRACMVAYTHYEGDNRVRRYTETLAEMGWEVDVVVLKNDNRPSLYTLKGVNVYGIQRRVLNEKSKFNYLFRTLKFLILSFLFISKKHLSNKYNLVHVHSVPDFEVFAALIPKITGTKIILDIHDIVPELYLAKFRKTENSLVFKLLIAMEKLSTMFADHVIIANHIWYDRIVSRSISKNKYSVILNYPDENIFKVVPKTEKEKFIIIYPGTLSKHQGVDVAIRAVNILRNEVNDLEFHIYGKGTDEDYLKNLVEQLDLSEKVKFFNSVSLEEIAKIMANADIGVEPKSDKGFSNEAFSTKILEFMLLGVPVIASDTSIHKYYLDSSVLKYFKAGDERDLSEAIKLLHDNIVIRNEFITNGRKFISKMCWSTRKSEYFNILENLIPGVVENLKETVA